MKALDANPERLDFGVFSIAREHSLLAGICLFLLALRLCLINLNHAEYTDGILQLVYFSQETKLWPPLYPLLCQAMRFTMIDLETCGKLISILASVLLLVPLYSMGRMLAGRSGALMAVLVCATQPIAWRWSVRLGTDSFYTFLYASSLFFLLAALVEIEKQTLFKLRAFTERKAFQPYQLLAASVLLGVMGGLTRYNAIVLIPPQLYGAWRLYRRPGPKKFRTFFLPLICLLSWGLVFWMIKNTVHGQQILERAGGVYDEDLTLRAQLGALVGRLLDVQTLANYLNVGESFLYLLPYFITLPVFIMTVWGWVWLARGETLVQRQFAWISVYLCLATLGMQSVFQSFQSRYLLPLVPLVAVQAGVAFAFWRRDKMRRAEPRRQFVFFFTILVLCLLHAAIWSGAVLVLQRGMWGDIRQAAKFARELPITNNTKVFSNEVYNNRMGIFAIKFPFWYGREIKVEPLTGLSVLPNNSYLILHSSYGGLNNYYRTQDQLNRRYEVYKIREFSDYIVPLFPDVMEEPMSHQNPSAWFFRYREQNFKTAIFHIIRPKFEKPPIAPGPE